MQPQSNTPKVSFTVPHLTPPSVNHYKVPCVYRDRRTGQTRKGMKETKESKAYKAAVAIFARGETVAPDTAKERAHVRYEVIARVYLGKGQRLDADNAGKVLIDALEGCGVIHSDAFVHRAQIEVFKDDRANPRTEVEVTRL